MILDEDQRLVRDTLRQFARERLVPTAAARDRSGEFPAEALAELAGLGAWGVVVPEAWHGWDDERRRAILLHEGEHVRQGDFWWQLAAGLYRAALAAVR